jgi:hypothetical protein
MKKIRDEPIWVIIHIYKEISQGNSLCSYLLLNQDKMSYFLFYLFSFFFCKIAEQDGGTSPAKGEGWHQKAEGGDGEKG